MRSTASEFPRRLPEVRSTRAARALVCACVAVCALSAPGLSFAQAPTSAPTSAPFEPPSPLVRPTSGPSDGAPETPGWEWRADVGGEFNASPHGVLDIGFRKGPFTAQLLTDTFDVRYAPSYASWRWWAGGRAEAYAAGLLPSPWQDGAPAPERGLSASYLGIDGGVVTYLPYGFYVGGQAAARGYTFAKVDKTAVPIPDDTLVASPEVVLGVSAPGVSVQVRGGADVQRGDIAPKASGEFYLRPTWAVAPFVEGRGGWARGQDFLTRTRLGGLNPYVVPLAGAGWAEFYVQRYGALRVGPSFAGELGEVAVFADAVVFDERSAPLYGYGGRVRFHSDALFLETTAGWSPNLPRSGGHAPVTVWIVAGLDWVPY
jgi:hypothetical protein